MVGFALDCQKILTCTLLPFLKFHDQKLFVPIDLYNVVFDQQ